MEATVPSSNIDSDQFIKYTKTIMILGGYWRKPTSSKPLYNNLYYVYRICIQIIYAVFWISLVLELYRLVRNGADTNVIVSSVGVITNASKIFVKILIFQKTKLLELYDDIMTNEKEILERNDPIVIASYKKYIKLNKKISVGLIVYTISSIVLFGTMGVVDDQQRIKYNRANNGSLESHGWYQFWFPATKLDHLGWTYSINLLISWTAGCYNCITHMIVNTSLLFAASQLRIFRIGIAKITQDIDPDALKEHCKRHLYLVRFIRMLNNKVKAAILMEFGLSSIDMASVVANLAKGMSNESVWMAVFFVLLLIQMFSLAIAADEVKEESAMITDSLYQAEWYLMDRSSARVIYLMMIGARIPLFVTIGPFGPMTLVSVVKILKAAYSYVSIMKE